MLFVKKTVTDLNKILGTIPAGALTKITRDSATKEIKSLKIKAEYMEIIQLNTNTEDLDSLFNLNNVNIQVRAFIDRKTNTRTIEVRSEYKIKTKNDSESIKLTMDHSISANFPFSIDPKLIDKSLVNYVLEYQAAQAVNIDFTEFNCVDKHIEFPKSIDELDSSEKINFDGYTQNFRRDNGTSYKVV